MSEFRNGCAEVGRWFRSPCCFLDFPQGKIPAGFQLASFQIRCTSNQMNWLKIRRIELVGGT